MLDELIALLLIVPTVILGVPVSPADVPLILLSVYAICFGVPQFVAVWSAK